MACMGNIVRTKIEDFELPSDVILGCFSAIVTAFIPIAIFVMQDGVEIRLDKFVVVNDVLSLNWYVAIFFVFIVAIVIKGIFIKKKSMLRGIVNILLLFIFALFLLCSIVVFKNSIMWLSDVPVSVASDNSYTSNPTLSEFLPSELGAVVGVRPENTVSYKKRSRLSYIEKSNSLDKKESLWEMFFNDEKTYEYEAKNDFWLYLREYYLFLDSIDDGKIAKRGFDNIKTHVKDLGVYVDEGAQCMYMSSTLVMLKDKTSTWKVGLWSELIAEYVSVALTRADLHSETRMCWLASLPQYLLDERLDVGGEEHLRLLADALWSAYNSFEVQTSQTHAVFYSDVPQEIVDFYAALSNAADSDAFYDYVKTIEGSGYDWGGQLKICNYFFDEFICVNM